MATTTLSGEGVLQQVYDPAGPALLVEVVAGGGTPGSVVLAPGENHIGSAGGNTKIVRVDLTVTASSAYSAGNCVGGLVDLGVVMRVAGGTGVLLALSAVEVGTQKAPLDVLIFSAAPAATFTDKSAFPTLSLADTKLIVAKVEVAAADYVTVGGVSMALEAGGTQALISDSGQHLWLAVNTSGTPTWAATTSLNFIIGISDD